MNSDKDRRETTAPNGERVGDDHQLLPKAQGKVQYKLGENVADWSQERLVDLVNDLAKKIQRLQRELERSKGHTKNSKPRKRTGRTLPDKPKSTNPVDQTHRMPPSEEQITDNEDIPVAFDVCPDCGGILDDDHWEDAYITDIEPPCPKVTHYRVQVRRCTGCHQSVRAPHAQVAPDQHGATAHRLGDRAMAYAHWLHFNLQVPQRKVEVVLKELAGVAVTQGALTKDAQKRAEQLDPDYQQERLKVGQAPVANTDDTSWRVGGEPAQVMVFSTPESTVYQIRKQHRNDEVREVLSESYPGTMVTDRAKSYDARAFKDVKQQKCQFHVLQSTEKVLDEVEGPDRQFPLEVKRVSQAGIMLWNQHRQGEITTPEYLKSADALLDQIDPLFQPRTLSDPKCQTLLDGLRVHHERGNLFRFLKDPAVPPTNNLAERELRPEVIGRKVSGGSKSWTGARARERLATIIRTEHRNNPHQVVEALTQRFQRARLRQQAQPLPD
jgi:transposase